MSETRNTSTKAVTPHDSTSPWWGMNRPIAPLFGARLVQEGNRLHYLADRTSIAGKFSDAHLRQLNQAFPLMLKELELMLVSGELNPRRQHCVTLYHNGLVCDADTLSSHGYVYLAIYPGEPPKA
ncbi:type IV toxin-antitoxin system YeeU family antitoxin [Enterobacter sp. CC120223-11]|uniref:type IV toxin-antitoxin system YeeU family antitoxin n=1 Tax=Enterobacter sp. CC120223-11 TaxID=1378073 RepID=UPI000BD026E2|nr:type IV toxin-antitoxin system YeeU family antitoxin [Enterobacter sp. CC120223-11]SNY61243.1 cytoskeleton bundling-enhancing protein CbeA [Enterobacter sp. CC120223-11]